jgi:hypothetical protein
MRGQLHALATLSPGKGHRHHIEQGAPVGLRVGLDVLEMRKISCFRQDSNPGPYVTLKFEHFCGTGAEVEIGQFETCPLLGYHAASCGNCYHTTQRNIPEVRRSQQHRSGSLKSKLNNLFEA